MDHAVALVQAYLQLNGYFTSAEYPIIAGTGRARFRTITDIDILAFRFPTGEPSVILSRADGERSQSTQLELLLPRIVASCADFRNAGEACLFETDWVAGEARARILRRASPTQDDA